MKPGCDVCLSVCLSVIGMRGMCDKHPPGARCCLGLTGGGGTTDIRSNGLSAPVEAKPSSASRRLRSSFFLL